MLNDQLGMPAHLFAPRPTPITPFQLITHDASAVVPTWPRQPPPMAHATPTHSPSSLERRQKKKLVLIRARFFSRKRKASRLIRLALEQARDISPGLFTTRPTDRRLASIKCNGNRAITLQVRHEQQS
jgi:hypothetical protein